MVLVTGPRYPTLRHFRKYRVGGSVIPCGYARIAAVELRHLRYFVAVAEEQNITRAAARLHVSQPPLSRQIRDLEEELGAELFERSARAVRLTPAGWAFLEECYGVLRHVDQAVRVAREAARGAREVNLGYAPGPTQELLREVLRVWRKTEPSVRVLLHDLTSKEMIDGVRSGRLQAALLVNPGAKRLRGLTLAALREDGSMLAVAPEHPFARRKTVTSAEVAREAMVVFSRAEYPEYCDDITHALGVAPEKLRIAQECDGGMSLIAAVEAGVGVAVLSLSLAPTIGTRLKLVPIEPAPPPTVVGLAWPTKSRDAALQRLVAAAQKLAQVRPKSTAARGRP